MSGNIWHVRNNSFHRNFDIPRPFAGPAMTDLIDTDLKNSPAVTRFVVWTGLNMGEVDQTDPLAERLKGRFKRVKEETWTARDHWRWLERFQLRRRTYERVGGPTTQTASGPHSHVRMGNG